MKLDLDVHALESLYTTMVKIRRFDERTTELFVEGLVKGTAHSYVGEEAVAAAACANLREGDYITGTHRGHGHCIAKGAAVDRMMAELMGRETGYCRGLGGSMHIADVDANILAATASSRAACRSAPARRSPRRSAARTAWSSRSSATAEPTRAWCTRR